MGKPVVTVPVYGNRKSRRIQIAEAKKRARARNLDVRFTVAKGPERPAAPGDFWELRK